VGKIFNFDVDYVSCREGSQVTTLKEDISKCLNNSSRTLFFKLRASAFLAVDGLKSTWYCHLEVELLAF
jgi:hypothetical protein